MTPETTPRSEVRPIAAVATVAVAAVAPALLRDRDAAKYLGRSTAWIRAKRAEYVKAEKEHRTANLARLPKHIRIGTAVFYRIIDLDKYIAENAVEGGAVSYDGKGTK